MATATQKKYTVGASYTPDTSAYADSTDSNAVALKAYDNQLNAYKAALQSAYESQAAENVNARNKLKSQYDASRSNVYTNARLSAIGNNERLASLGLAGNLYDYARSGTSETNRIAQDIAMRKSLASLNQSENEAYSDYQLPCSRHRRKQKPTTPIRPAISKHLKYLILPPLLRQRLHPVAAVVADRITPPRRKAAAAAVANPVAPAAA